MLRVIVTPEELGQRLRRNRLVVLLFTAEWNDPAKEVRQMLEDMAVQYKEVLFVEARVETQRNTPI